MRLFILVAMAALISVTPHAQGQHQPEDLASLPFRNPDLPLAQRVDDLIGRLTLEEKASLMVERAAPVERLGIPAFPWWNEALHGVARAGRATVFPQAIGLAATWDTDLMERVATAIADEARAMQNRASARGQRHLYQGLTFWSPNINIFRDPRWGRGQETYGEDPVLTGEMGVAFVKGLQGDDPRYLKTIATPKHFAVHSGPEPDRHTFDARPSELDLQDTYLPAFRATVVDAKAWSVMCAYNAFRGLPACGSDELLQKILRTEWGFGGYVVSDCAAIRDIYENHKARKTAEEAAVMAVRAGTDLECGTGSFAPGSPDAYLTLTDAVESGKIEEATIDAALRRLLTAQMRLGVYDPPERVPFTKLTYESVVNSPKHRELAVEAARKSIVLLKNDARTLPLRKDLETLAVIGPNADQVEVLLGNYHGTPIEPVTVLKGIQAAVGTGTKILYARGGPLATGMPDLQKVPADALSTTTSASPSNLSNPSTRTPGLAASFYRGIFEGAPVTTRVDRQVDFDWADDAPVSGLERDGFSVRWTGQIKAPVTGQYTLGFRGANAFRLFVNNRIVAQGRSDHEPPLASGQLTMRAGRSYPIRIELEHEKYDAVAELFWQLPGDRDKEIESERAEAVAAAKAADATVLVLGLSSRLEGEEMRVVIEGFNRGDRTSLDLPATQRRLLEEVVRASGTKPVVVVLLSGSALAVNWAQEHVPAILQAWYPGQAGGTAVADVLFGNVSPAGRLPITVYRSAEQLPAFSDYSMKERTYRYFTGDPLYAFGHGLSYSPFTYSNLVVPAKAPIGKSVDVSVQVRNTGSIAADEVVQVYVSHDRRGEQAPLRALKAFRRVSVQPGQSQTVRFTLDDRALSLVAPAGERSVEPGRVSIAVGGRQPAATRGTAAPSPDVLTGVVQLTGSKKAVAR